MERELQILREEKERESNALNDEKRENEQVRWEKSYVCNVENDLLFNVLMTCLIIRYTVV